jgi:hypothetical protein
VFYINYLLIKTKLNNNGVNMPKPIQFKKLLLLMLLFSSSTNVFPQIIKNYIDNKWKDSRYIVDHENETVTDTITALMWKRCPEGSNGSKCLKGTLVKVTWKGAIERAEAGENKPFATYSDWRLPNIKELVSLVAEDRTSPAFNSSIFPDIPNVSGFWSSSPSISGNNTAWQLELNKGEDYIGGRSGKNYVRLVRDIE